MTNDQANKILNQAKDGQPVTYLDICKALIATGDLESTMRGSGLGAEVSGDQDPKGRQGSKPVVEADPGADREASRQAIRGQAQERHE